MRYFSPAKVNLFFHVKRKRADHFHEIESLMQTLSFGDTLEIRDRKEGDLFWSASSKAKLEPDNLILEGVRLFRKKTGLNRPLYLELEKRIPMQSGLGGGSSNLATTLWALDDHFGTQLGGEKLREWAAELSSDAPFFFSLGRAFVSGRGEIVEEVLKHKEESVWIAKPCQELSTKLVYAHCLPQFSPAASPGSNAPKRRVLEQFLAHPDLAQNDLESAAFTLVPELKDLKGMLFALGFDRVLMSGSGTAFCCFGQLKKRPTLEGVDFFAANYLFREATSWY